MTSNGREQARDLVREARTMRRRSYHRLADALEAALNREERLREEWKQAEDWHAERNEVLREALKRLVSLYDGAPADGHLPPVVDRAYDLARAALSSPAEQ